MESDSAMDSDSDAEAPEKRIMSYMYLFEAKLNYYHRDWDATSYMRRYLDLRRYQLKQPELIAFAAIDQEQPNDDTAYTSNFCFLFLPTLSWYLDLLLHDVLICRISSRFSSGA